MPSFDYAQLKQEIAHAEYNGMNDAQKAAHVNAKTVTGALAPLPIVTAVNYLFDIGVWLAIKDNAASGSPCVGARAVVEYNDNQHTQFLDFTKPAVTTMAASLVSAGLLTQDQVSALVAMATPILPFLPTIGWSVMVTDQDIAATRNPAVTP